MTRTCPSLPEFLERARQSFGYLSSEFGFTEATPGRNEFSVSFVKEKTTLLVEGINWGYAVNVLVNHDGITVPLWAIAIARGYAVSDLEELSKGDQLSQLSGYAMILRDLARDALSGDLSVIASAAEVVAQAHAEAQQQKVRWLP